MPIEILQVVPTEARHPEIGRWLWALAEVRNRTLATVEGCDQQALDWTGADGRENSIGSLLYHIAAVEMYWVFLDVLAQDLPGDVKELLPLPGFEDNRMTRVPGVSLWEHVERLHATRNIANTVFAEMDVDDWRRVSPPVDKTDEYEVSPEWAVFHLIEHEAGHTAQMSSLKARWRRRSGSTSEEQR